MREFSYIELMGLKAWCSCRWNPDNEGKPTYKSYDVDINRYDLHLTLQVCACMLSCVASGK